MKKVLLLLTFFSMHAIAFAQFNDFEQEANLPVEIGTATGDSLWQIGTPQKDYFDAAFNAPNAILTDTTNTYTINDSAVFIVKIAPDYLNVFPFAQLSWRQKIDTEAGVDGGIVEASYDNGDTWQNVLDSPEFRPVIAAQNLEFDTLSNGQAGFSGTRDWQYIGLCWGTYFGELPLDIDSLFVRFTFVSDSVDTQQDGWMMDDFIFEQGLIGTADDEEQRDELNISPNPAADFIYINIEGLNMINATAKVYDLMGRLILTNKISLSDEVGASLNVTQLKGGTYIVKVENEFFSRSDVFIKK